jgi:hypothetical protein
MLAFCTTHHAAAGTKRDGVEHVAGTAGRAVGDHFKVQPTLVSFMAGWWEFCKREAV